MADALAALAREGRTVVFSTHDAALAAYASDSVVLIREGRLLASGPSAEILSPELLSRTFAVPFGVSGAPSPFVTGSSIREAGGGIGSGSWPR